MAETAVIFFGKDCTERNFRAHFGQHLVVVAYIWAMFLKLSLLDDGDQPVHLLWMVYWWRVYPTFDVAGQFFEVCPKTFRVAVLKMQLHCVRLKILRWDERFDKSNGSRALVTVDCTDCPIWEPTPFSQSWWSFKFNGAGVRYELAVCIQTGMIVWVNGSFRPAYWTDLTIFRHGGLMAKLAIGEWIAADKGYRDGSQFVLHKGSGPDWFQNMTADATARHENINGRMKRFRILSEKYRNKLEMHETTFLAIANVINCEMELGYEPMIVDYDDVGLGIH